MVSVATGPSQLSRQCRYWAGPVRKSTWGSGPAWSAAWSTALPLASLVMVNQPLGSRVRTCLCSTLDGSNVNHP